MNMPLTQVEQQARSMADHFYLAQGVLKPPPWENCDAGFRKGFLSLAQRVLDSRRPAQASVAFLSRERLEEMLARAESGESVTLPNDRFRHLVMQAMQGLPQR